MKGLSVVFSFALVLVLLGGTQTARAEETEARPVGVGYKIGNGIGFLGADVIVRAIPYVAFDLQANYLSESVDDGSGTTGTATGYGFAPTVQLQLKPVGHTPYLGVGFAYVHLSLGDVTGSASALLANLGYEWRFASGVGVLLGGGIADIGSISAMGADGRTISESGGLHFNIEASVRYYFPFGGK
jgi:hypothetical protein